MGSLISSNILEIQEFFKSHKIEKDYVFGSAAKGKLDDNSDIDFLVKFQDCIDPFEKGEL